MELMLAAWHPTRWQDWHILQDDKKEIQPLFIDEKQYKFSQMIIVSQYHLLK